MVLLIMARVGPEVMGRSGAKVVRLGEYFRREGPEIVLLFASLLVDTATVIEVSTRGTPRSDTW